MVSLLWIAYWVGLLLVSLWLIEKLWPYAF